MYKYQNSECFERYILDPIVEIIDTYSEMTANERYFLNGMIRYVKPKKVLEVGVSAGGSSAILLNAIKDFKDTKVYSVDYMNFYYKSPNLKVGFVIDDFLPDLKNNWHLYTGGDISCFMNDIGGEIDFLLLDTVHIHPWETFNFLCILPFLSEGAWVVLHDIHIRLETNYLNEISHTQSLACKYLFGHVTSENKILPTIGNTHINAFPNIGAFQITADTHKYVKDIFTSLSLPWGIKIKPKDIKSIETILHKYYPKDLVNIFEASMELQEVIAEKKRTRVLKEKRIIFFGVGSASKSIFNKYAVPIEYFVDNDSSKWGNKLKNIGIYNPTKLLTEDKNDLAVIVASQFYCEIAKQLTEMGFQENVHFWNGFKIF